MSDNINRFYCLLGRDNKDVEQRELSADTARLFTDKLHTLNYTNFLLKIRDLFLNTKRGEAYTDHGIDDLPRTFFYCPLPIESGTTRDAAAVWGECGIYSGGREFRYAHYYIEDYSTLDSHTLICKLFTSKYCTDSEITDLLSHSAPSQQFMKRVTTYDPDYVKEISDRCRFLVSAVAEKLCGEKTVIIRLAEGNDFNRDSKDIIAQIMSMLPGDFRRQVGFITYLQTDQIKRFRDQSNNVRLIVVDSDVDVSEFETSEPFAVFNFDKDYIGDVECDENFVEWSRIEFADREQQIAQFAKIRSGELSSTREILPKMIEVYREAERFAAEFPDTEVEKCSTPEELARYFNRLDICRIVPRARQQFVKEIPRMLPDGVNLEDMLLDALRRGDEQSKKAARFCLFNFVKDQSKLIEPIERQFGKAYNDGAERQRGEDEIKLDALDKKAEQLTSELEKLRAAHNERGVRIDSLEKERAGLTARAEELSGEIERLGKELEDKTSDYNALNSKLGELNGVVSQLKSDLMKLEIENTTERGKNSDLTKAIGSLKKDYSTKCDENDALTEKLKNTDSELTASRSECNAMKAENESLGERLNLAESEARSATEELDKARLEIGELERNVKSKDAEIADVRTKLNESELKRKECEEKLDSANARIKEVSDQSERLCKEAESEKARADEAEAARKSAAAVAEQLKAEKESDLKRIEGLEIEASSMKHDHDEEISKLKHDHEEEFVKLKQTCEEQIAKLKKALDDKKTIGVKSLDLMSIIAARLDIKLIIGGAFVAALVIGLLIGLIF